MKKSIFKILCVSALFISFGGALDRVSSIYNSEGKIAELVELTRNAVDHDTSWSDDGSKNITVNVEKIFIEKGEHMIEEMKTDGKHKVFVRRDESGKVLTETFTPTDGKKIIIVKDVNGNVITENEVGPR